jgi:putative nucleotidyltransferase-like protein
LNRIKILAECFKGLICFEDRFNRVNEKHASWICERLIWHKVLPLAAALNNSSKQKCPAIESAFKRTSIQNAVREAYYEKQVKQIFNALTEAAIDFFPFKGPFWSQQLYPDYFWKHIGDIDLLLVKKDARRAVSIIQDMGYVPERPIDATFAEKGELALFPDSSANKKVPVELHWEILPSPRFLKMYYLHSKDFTENTTTAQWKSVYYHLPSKEIQLFYLILHATCQHQFARFIHIINITHFIQKFPNIRWNTLERLARKRSATTPLYYGLRFANAFFPLKDPALSLMKSLTPSIKIRLAASPLKPLSTLLANNKRGRFPRKLFRAAMSWQDMTAIDEAS